MNPEQQVRQKIQSFFDTINRAQLPYLSEKIATDAGRQTAADSVFDIAVKHRVSLQTAMSIYDTQLSEILPQ